MKIGFIGLGRMGSAMAQNLAKKNHQVVVYNRSPGPTKKLTASYSRITASYSSEELVSKLPRRKIIWLMITAGKPTDSIIEQLIPLLKKGDIIIDGSNSYFKDSQARQKLLKRKDIHFLDCGVSGGIEGARNGACLMIGGDKKVFDKVQPIFKSLATKNGYAYIGKSGAGHFVKGVHNGIEYGMMASIAEGMDMLRSHKISKKLNVDLKESAKVYAHGSIIESRLMSWLYDSFKQDGYLDHIACEVPKGETEEEMKKLEKLGSLKMLKQARKMRVHSRKGLFCGDYIAAMRNQFGGHKVNKTKKKKKLV